MKYAIFHTYIDQFMLPRIFKYLIGAKDVEISMYGESVLEIFLVYGVNIHFPFCFVNLFILTRLS